VDKYQYLIEALKGGAYKKVDWLVSLFCLFSPDTKNQSYAYKLKKGLSGYAFTAPDLSEVQIEGTSLNEPLFTIADPITVTPDMIDNVTGSIESNVSTLVANYVLLIYPFGNRIPYVATRFDPYDVLDEVKKDFRSNVKPGETKDPKAYYVEDLLKFGKACFFMSSLTQVCTIGATEKNMTAPDGIEQYKAQLQKEYADRLSDPAALAEMDGKLIDFDAKWREGDEGNDFLMNDKKAIKIVRKKKFLQLGGELGVGDSTKLKYLGHSLDEGHTLESFPDVNNTMRMGSFARGAETMLGGVEVKNMFRVSGSMNVVLGTDCKSKLGMPRPITLKNKAGYKGYHLVDDKGQTVKIEDEKQLDSFVGKYARFRSPAYCLSAKTDKCEICAGPTLSATPNALPTSVSNYGSTFMGLSMSQNHGKVLAVQELDLNDLFV
jgi:hypothetical protein